jgi:hypothetical protein
MWWEKIFLCPGCYKVATRIQERGEARLKWLLAILRQAIKDALLEGRLQFATEDEANEPDKPENAHNFLHLLQELAARARVTGEQ